MLSTLTSYLAGHDNLKKVINSPCLDHHGKLLSRDGTKVFTASSNYNRRGGRFNKNGRGGKGGGQKNGGGKNNQKRRRNNGSDNQVS